MCRNIGSLCVSRYIGICCIHLAGHDAKVCVFPQPPSSLELLPRNRMLVGVLESNILSFHFAMQMLDVCAGGITQGNVKGKGPGRKGKGKGKGKSKGKAENGKPQEIPYTNLRSKRKCHKDKSKWHLGNNRCNRNHTPVI